MVETQHSTLRQQYSATTKARILKAANTVFADRGFHRATTKAIAETAGTSEGTIYRYFDSKRDLLISVLDSMIGGTEEGKEVVQATRGNFRAAYVTMVKERIKRLKPQSSTFFALMSHILTDQDLSKQMYKKMFMPALKLAEELLQDSINSGNIRPIDVPLTARLVYSLAFGIDLLYMMGDTVIRSELENADKLAELIATVILDGISAGNSPDRKDENIS